jgi:site-specific DNA-cytosine methylase
MAIKLLIGGSPCTHWSIAQKNNRETVPEGEGWELFKNYLIAREKFQPDFFLYENNKSASQPIKDQIAHELGVGVDEDARFTYINSALVSAQNRQRFYVTNFGDIEQPEDRGILLKDILETGEDLTSNDKSYCMTASYDGACGWNTIERSQRTMVAEPVCHTIPQEVTVRKYTCDIEKFQDCLRSHKNLTNKEIAETLDRPVTEVEHWFRKDKCFSIPDADVWFELKKILNIETTEFDDFVTVFETREGVFEKSHRCYDVNGKMSTLMTTSNDNIIEPIRVGSLPRPNGELSQSQAFRIYDVKGKSVNINAGGGGAGGKTGLYAIPVNTTDEEKSQTIKAQYQQTSPINIVKYKSTYGATGVAEPLNIDDIHSLKGKSNYIQYDLNGNNHNSQDQRVYYPNVKHGALMSSSTQSKTGVIAPICYSQPIEWDKEGKPTKAISYADGKTYTVYEVKNGIITIKGKEYPIKLEDGFYIIRKLTVTECCRLQTMPDDYCKAVSDSRAYAGLGNGWVAEVIIHLLNHALKDVPRDEEIIVLSMYDGIGTGRYCLDKMGFTNIKYYAYEIDKYPIAIAMDNYPDIIQCGDAYAVREEDWEIHSKR